MQPNWYYELWFLKFCVKTLDKSTTYFTNSFQLHFHCNSPSKSWIINCIVAHNLMDYYCKLSFKWFPNSLFLILIRSRPSLGNWFESFTQGNEDEWWKFEKNPPPTPSIPECPKKNYNKMHEHANIWPKLLSTPVVLVVSFFYGGRGQNWNLVKNAHAEWFK